MTVRYSHSIALEIIAADYHQREMSDYVSDSKITFGIVHTHLAMAAQTTPDRLPKLYERWNRQECDHPAEARALCIVLEHLESVMRQPGLLDDGELV